MKALLQIADVVGVRTVAFRSGGWSEAGRKGAVAVYAGPWDLLDRFATSPFAAGAGKR